MRLRLTLIGLIALAFAAPAAADIRIRYVPDDPSGMGLTIEADYQGRIRAEGDNGQYLIVRDGDIYLVQSRDGEPVVARIDDVLALSTTVAEAARQTGFINPIPPDRRYRIEERGSQNVGTWSGTSFAIAQVGPHDAELDTVWVVSTDPSLAEAGRLAVRVFEIQGRLFSAVMGENPPEFRALMRQVSERGAPLRLQGLYRLDSVSRDPVPASRFELPAPALSLDQLRARLSR